MFSPFVNITDFITKRVNKGLYLIFKEKNCKIHLNFLSCLQVSWTCKTWIWISNSWSTDSSLFSLSTPSEVVRRCTRAENVIVQTYFPFFYKVFACIVVTSYFILCCHNVVICFDQAWEACRWCKQQRACSIYWFVKIWGTVIVCLLFFNIWEAHRRFRWRVSTIFNPLKLYTSNTLILLFCYLFFEVLNVVLLARSLQELEFYHTCMT
jgi:hypothetical protein